MTSTLCKKIGKLLLIFLLCISHFALVGCWDRREINDIAIVLATGVDAKEEEIELSVEVVLPQMMGGTQGGGARGEGRTTYVESATGVTLAEARSKLQQKISRTLFWGHAEATIIGEKLAEKGIQEQMDFFARNPEARLRNMVFVSKGKAKDILAADPHIETSVTEAVVELANIQIGMNVTMNELLQMLKSETGGAALPVIEPLSPGTGKEEKKTDLSITGTAIFKKDKMVGMLDMGTTRGLLWLRDEIRYATITVEPEEAKGHVTMEMIRSKTELIPQIEDEKWKVTLKISTEDDVIQNASHLDLRNPEFIKLLEKEAEKQIDERVKKALDLLQKEMKVDVFGLGESFQRKYPKKWKEEKERWEEIFPTVEVAFETKVVILRPGVSKQSQGLPQKEVKQK